MNYILKDREPKLALKYFEEISQIPRGSGDEKAIAQYIIDFAKKRNLYVHTDELNNVFIRKEATKGHENIKPILLQGHTDMVCEKNMDVEHDFTKDPIELILDGDLLKANATTLGADDGVAVAYMLAILDSNDIAHPTLECLFTTSEETGMFGAFGFDTNQITARRLLNLDSDNEHQILSGSAGGLRIGIIRDFEKQPAIGKALTFKIHGLMGGHSGGDIHMEKGNANKLMGRLLYEITKISRVNIANIIGGSKDNAIPRESIATICVDESKVNEIKTLAKDWATDIATELEASDGGFTLDISNCNVTDMFDDNSSKDIISILKLVPNGVRATSMALKGLVVTSLNMGVVEMHENNVEIHMSLRSSVESLILNLADEVEMIAHMYNAKTQRGSKYPGWKFEVNSPLRDLCAKIYKDMNNKEPEVVAIHAGLECGLFKDKIPDLDIISTGPYCYDIHTPAERLDLNSCARVWKFILKVLEEVK